MIARDLEHLHGDTLEQARLGNGLNSFHARTEKGEFLVGITGRRLGAGPSVHHTCSSWTSDASGEGSAQVGHFDRMGFDNNSWNSSHATRGCSQEDLVPSGGAGLLYCFAID